MAAYVWVGAPVPAEVLALAHAELSIGAKRMLETCVRSNRARCLSSGTHAHAHSGCCTYCGALDRVPRPCAVCAADGLVNAADELESVLRSLAWQSPSLAAYMKPKLKREDECELLTADDMAELMADTKSCVPKRQKRSSDNTPRSPPEPPRESAPAAYLHTHDDDAEECAGNRESAARSACVETGAPVSGGPLPAGPCSATRIQNRVAGPLGPVRDRSLTPLGGEPSGQALEGVAHRFQELTLLQQREASASS
jgi:hypothetical protein